jgi:hypothetical protein
MKKLWFNFSIYLFSILPLTAPVSVNAASRFSFPGTLPASYVVRGAANPQELAQTVLQAIQDNKPDGLNEFLLGEAEFVQLKNKGSEDIKAFLENTTVLDLQNTFRSNYDELVQKGISQTINWSELNVSETRLGKGSVKDPRLQPVTITLTDKQNQPVTLLLETININKRYYLFRKIELLPRP